MVWKTVESQGTVCETTGNFENDIEWQPCILAQKKMVLTTGLAQ